MNNDNWFPTHYSENEIDFVYWNKSPLPEKLSPKIALGCSNTIGTEVGKNKNWPSLIGYSNCGVSGIGIDAIYMNAVKVIEKVRPKKIVILFPNMERRLCIFHKSSFYFRLPVSFNGIHSDHVKDTKWISKNELQNLINQTSTEIIKDENNKYSKTYLDKISRLDVDIMVSSWSKGTYQELPNYFKKVLPIFEFLDQGFDGIHPGEKSHKMWADQIKNHNI